MSERPRASTAPTSSGLADCESWRLTPEGAAIHVGERTAVIADVHLGYEWARGAAGDCVPAHSLEETRARLATLLARAPIERLIVAGDLVESPRPCRRTATDIERLGGWLESLGVRLLVLAGNHDRSLVATARRASSRIPPLPADCTIDGWTIGHGHRPLAGDRTMSGHLHPVVRIAGISAPCFLAGPGRIVLPAFSANAAGFDVVTAGVPREWLETPLRCIASTGVELIDLGLLPALRRRRHLVR